MLDKIEKSTIPISHKDIERASEESMECIFKLFPIIESISQTLFNSRDGGRAYLKKLGYLKEESNLIYNIFRNGIMHSLKPYIFKYKDGELSWGYGSSSGSGGFRPYYPGYVDSVDSKHNISPEKAFFCVELSKGFFHADLSIDRLVAQIKYDLKERKEKDKRKKINVIVGVKMNKKINDSFF